MTRYWNNNSRLNIPDMVSFFDIYEKNLQDPSIPIGAVIPFLKHMTSFQLPNGFVECNGQTLNDPQSPLNGQVIPNLNSGIFVRGNTSAGSGGQATHTHQRTISTGGVTATDTGGAYSQWNYTIIPNHQHTGDVGSSTSSSNIPPFYTVVWIMRVK